MKTGQAPFQETYHHIEAPTIADDEWGREHKQRRLYVPEPGFDQAYFRSPLLAYLANLPWAFSRKIDGENIRIKWDGEQAVWNGKTDSFQCNFDFHNYMDNTFLEEIFEEKFGRDKTVLLFGEKMGPKTQGNELGLDHAECILYDVKVNDTWLDKNNVEEVASYFGAHTVYDFMDDSYKYPGNGFCANLYDLIIGCSTGKFKDWEGIVAHPLIELRAQNGARVIVKIKNKDYYHG